MVDVNGETFENLNHLLAQRATESSPKDCFLRCPVSSSSRKYFQSTAAELQDLARRAATQFVKKNLKPVSTETVVAVLGKPGLDYIITFVALCQLGYSVLMLSPHLTEPACINLLKQTNAKALLFEGTFKDQHLQSQVPSLSESFEYLSVAGCLALPSNPSFDQNAALAIEPSRTAFIMHSSGTTSLPRPITFTHQRMLGACVPGLKLRALLLSPVYHTHGLCIFYQRLYKSASLQILHPETPQTPETLVQALRDAKPEIVYTVPFNLRLIADREEGVELLKQCKAVSYSGARCPDELGSRLVAQGVHLGSVYGTSETAMVFTSLDRPRSDKAWNYLRPLPHAIRFIYMKHLGDGSFELIVLDGHKGKTASNSNDPPGSFHTRDVFEPHPEIDNAWKYLGRLDDCITLLTGRKIFPVGVEEIVRQHDLVKEAVVFGAGRMLPGILIVKRPSADNMSEEAFIDSIWPSIIRANTLSGLSIRDRALIIILPSDTTFPVTEKGSISRLSLYSKFAKLIDATYARREDSWKLAENFDTDMIEEWLIRIVRSAFDMPELEVNANLLESGIDSVGVMHLKSLIEKNFNSQQRFSLRLQDIYECGTCASIAEKLHSMRSGDFNRQSETLEEMVEIIRRCGFPKHHGSSPSQNTRDGIDTRHIILLTGATGRLGSAILTQLLPLQNVGSIWCHVRAEDERHGFQKLLRRLEQHEKLIAQEDLAKLVVYVGSMDALTIGLRGTVEETFENKLTHIIHTAYPINFNQPQKYFTPHCSTLHRLLLLSLSTSQSPPAKFIFTSSISVALSTPGSSSQLTIPSARIPSLTHASPTGYATSKLVCERLIEKAVLEAGASCTIFRIGQLIPSSSISCRDSKLHTQWDPNDALSLIARSARSLGVLPDCLATGDACSWLPVDTAARAMLEITKLVPKGIVASDATSRTTATATATATMTMVSCTATTPTKDNNGNLNVKESPSPSQDSSFKHSHPSSTTTAPPPPPQRLFYNLLHQTPCSWKTDILPALARAGMRFTTITTAAGSSFEAWVDTLRSCTSDHGGGGDASVPASKLLSYWESQIQRRREEGTGRKGGSDGADMGRMIRFDTSPAWEESFALREVEGLVDGGWVDATARDWAGMDG